MSIVKTSQETISGITPETLDATVRAFRTLDDSSAVADDFVHNLAAHIVHQVEVLSGVKFVEKEGGKTLAKAPLTQSPNRGSNP